MKRKSPRTAKPDGSVRVKKRPNGKEVTYIKENGKWVYQKQYPNGFTDKWGNFHKVGRGESSVIGKSGPRPELRSLCYGVGINDVMIPYFTSTRTWRTWSGIIRRTDNRDPKWINEQNKTSYVGCTLDSRWYKLSAFKEWIEQWDDFENKEVDKDILIPGNKIYGPDTCLMVRPSVNAWFKPTKHGGGDLPRGVTWNNSWKKGRSPNPYRAQITPIGGKRTALGYYATAEEASAVFEKARKEQIKILIETETDPKVKNAMMECEFK